MRSVPKLFFALPVLLAGVLAVAFFLYAPPSAATPSVSWSPSALSQVVTAGQSTTTTATFTATENAQNVTVRVVPEIAPYVTVSPSSFETITKGASYPVTVTFAAVADALTGLYDGTIHLLQGKKTLSQPLMVDVAVDGKPILVQDPEGGLYPVNEIELSLVDGTTIDDAQRLAKLVHGTIFKLFLDTNTYYLIVPTSSILELENAIHTLELDPSVDYATTNDVVQLDGFTSDLQHLRTIDPQYTKAYDLIAVEQAWAFANGTLRGPPNHIHVGIIDTGIDALHPEFLGVERFGVSTDPGSTSPGSYGCPGRSVSSHGTQVAGIIGANNLSVISSLAPNSPHMNGIIAGLTGADYSLSVYPNSTYDVLRSGIATAILNGAQIFNFSLGGVSCNAPNLSNCDARGCLKNEAFSKRKEYWEDIFDKYPDVVFVASAGNNKVAAGFHLPGGGVWRPNLITVGATSLDDEATWAGFSNDGAGVDIAAPGENVYAPGIYSPPLDREDYKVWINNESYEYFGGTSAAAPMVTGVVAMMMAVSEEVLSPVRIKAILRQTADPPCTDAPRVGCRVNAEKAIKQVLQKQAISPLNDTGITWGGEYPSGNNATCTSATTDITAQDCSHGRDVTHNDDSDGHAGFSFTKLDSNGNPLPASATSWTCIRDNVTGLIWEVKTDDGGLRDKAWNYTSYDSTYADAGDNQTDGGPDGVWAGPLDNGLGSFGDNCANQYKICTTEQYVADVNMVGLCGAHNWRMPTAKELENITNKDRYNPMIDNMAFPNTRATEFWSSSPFAGTSYSVWYVDFYRSGAQPNSYRYHYHPVRLVRGGSPLSISPISAVDDQVCKPAIPASTPTSQFIDHGDGTVTDAGTNLMWNRCAYGQTWDGSTCTGSYMNTTWYGALQESAVVNRGGGYAGYTDWRLPNINELRSIVEEQCYSPAINLNVFPNTPSTIFWSSSPNAYNSQIAWGVHFFSGSIDSGGRSNDYLGGYAVRLVRGGK